MKKIKSISVLFVLMVAGYFTSLGFVKPKPKPIPKEVQDILDKHGCIACHRPNHRVIGPSFAEIAKRNYSAEEMAELILKPKPENWPGYAKMIGVKDVPLRDVVKIKTWMDTLDDTE